MIKYQNIVTTSIAKQIAETIREAILSGHLKVDERLPTEDELAKRYGVSRPTIREALKRLAAQNLIRSRRGPTGGNFVMRPDPEDMAQTLSGSAMLLMSMGAFDHDEIADARQELQGMCSRLAAQRRTQEHLDRMAEEIAIQQDPNISDEQFCASDVRFHRAIVDAADNAFIGFVMYGVVEAMTPVTNMVIVKVRNRQNIAERHIDLMQAIADQNAVRAVTVVSGLMDYLRDQYSEALAAREARQDELTK